MHIVEKNNILWDSLDTDTYMFIFTRNLQTQVKEDYGQKGTEIIRLVMLHMKTKEGCLDKLIASLRKNASPLLITFFNYIQWGLKFTKNSFLVKEIDCWKKFLGEQQNVSEH